MKKFDFYWKFFEQPKRRMQSFIRYTLLKRDNAYLIQKEANKYRNQLMLDTWEVVRLLGWSDSDDDDYYWITYSWKNGIRLLSCVGGFTPLKGKLSNFDYYHLENLWELNGHSAAMCILKVFDKKIIIK